MSKKELTSKQMGMNNVIECMKSADLIMNTKRPSLLKRVNASIYLHKGLEYDPDNPQILLRLVRIHKDNPETCLSYIKRLATLPKTAENKKYIDTAKQCLKMLKTDNLIN